MEILPEITIIFGFFLLILLILILLIKIHLLQKSAQEIEQGFTDSLTKETNVLITVSSHDRYLLHLAESINVQLRKLRNDRHRYQQGDLEIKEAITNISHDLRTPLTAVCGYIDLLEQEELTENSKRYLAVIKTAHRCCGSLRKNCSAIPLLPRYRKPCWKKPY